MKRAIIACAALLASSLVAVDLPGFTAAAALPPPNILVCQRWTPIGAQSWFHNGFHFGVPFIVTSSEGVTTTYSQPTGDEVGVYVVATINPEIVQRCPVLNDQNKLIGKNVDFRISIEQFYICAPPVVDERLTLSPVGGVLGFTQADCDAFVLVDEGSGSSWHHR